MANNDKESKNEIDDYQDCITFKNRAMRRGKPHQQIYTPGSGPLRKSGQEFEETHLRQSHINDCGPDFKSNRKKPDNRGNTENLNNMHDMDFRRRSKKPEQPIYVPKPMAQAQAEREYPQPPPMNHERDRGYGNSRSMQNLSKNSHYDTDSRHNRRNEHHNNGNLSHQNHNHNGSSERLNNPGSFSKSKRFSATRRQGLEHLNHGGDRRYGGGNRDSRQASEPRALAPPTHQMNRIRDTRSVEPAGNSVTTNHYQSSKMQSKPPSGRRHSTICLDTGKPFKPMLNLDSMPPRFRRKYFAENNIDPSTYPGVLEDTWDGNSATFQGSDNSNTYQQQNVPYQQEARVPYPVPSYVNSHNVQHPESNMPLPPVWSYTIPEAKVRGRGRLRPESIDSNYSGQILRSLTPDRIILISPANSRPCTPPPFAQKNRSNENVHAVDSSSRNNQNPPSSQHSSNSNKINTVSERVIEPEPVKVNPEAKKSPVQKQQPVSLATNLLNEVDDNFDWSEEVELNDRLEAEALSDSMTRCSSVASLVESVPQQQQPQSSHKSRKHKRNNRGNRNRSSSRNNRDRSAENQNKNQANQDFDNNHKQHNRRNKQQSNNDFSYNRENLDKDGFKVPEPRNNRRRKNSFRERSNERRQERKSNNDSRNSSIDRSRRNSCNEVENWREEIRMRNSSERKIEPHISERRIDHPPLDKVDFKEQGDKATPGIIILPKSPVDRSKPPVLLQDPMFRNKPVSRMRTSPVQQQQQQQQQRTLYDPNNPNKPIIVAASNSRAPNNDPAPDTYSLDTVMYTTDQFGNVGPSWYNPNSETYKTCRQARHLDEVKNADFSLQFIIKSGTLIQLLNNQVANIRQFLRDSLEFLLVKEIKFCQTENVENHYWKILYYNIIEIMRKSVATDPDNKVQYNNIILALVDEGTKYFERILEVLEEIYKFRLDNHVGINNMAPSKGLGFVGLALVSAQKIFLFLGDLARYKENANETTNYRKCRQWYSKAQEINPKNGRPYNQLAVLAVYSRRKLDAVYFYMRSLMSSNPVQSAKDSLKALFEENRKKYEQTERKRREEKAKLQMKEKESTQNVPGSLRREIWIHPDSGRRLHRTTSAAKDSGLDSEEEDLQSLSSLEVNKRFITSYLHVHGKLITKIGMETFQHAALQMLREFRVLLQQTPVHLSCNRFLQLLALNMFAIETTQLKDPDLEPSCRSEVQERALIISLQMFNVILERCVDLLQSHIRQQERAYIAANVAAAAPETSEPQHPVPLSEDLQVILRAVKVWCDWMLCHSSVWNPPPSCSDFRVGPSGDAWSRLAILMNFLEKLDYPKPELEYDPSDDCYMVRLPEDATMCGFTPLMYNSQPQVYIPDHVDMESAQMSFRIGRLLFFGTEFLCGLEPPVLKLQRYDIYSEYISVVRTSSRDSPSSPEELCNDDLLIESFSEDEDEQSNAQSTLDGSSTSGEIRSLLDRKIELEKRHRTQELHRQHVQAILHQSVVSVEIEVRPRYLVPDTNCFIDYLDRLQTLTRTHGPQPYTLMVPLVVLGELEGLARGGKAPAPAPRLTLDPEHLLRVADASRRALDFLHCRNPAVKCLTTRGTVLTSSTFTSEDEDRSHDVGPRNDDRILATCLSLCRGHLQQPQQLPEESDHQGDSETSGPRRIYREVVLLTDDRNLRVKALARDVPVRELPDFLQWAGLG